MNPSAQYRHSVQYALQAVSLLDQVIERLAGAMQLSPVPEQQQFIGQSLAQLKTIGEEIEAQFLPAPPSSAQLPLTPPVDPAQPTSSSG